MVKLYTNAYNDDIEVVNPIGVNVKKNKLSLFFWALVSIPPHLRSLRSRLCIIQLLAVAKAVDVKKFGASKLLNNFVSDLRHMYTLERNDPEYPRCWLVAFLGDTLASNAAAGFKEGVGFALKICRTCEATQENNASLLYHEDCKVRNDAEHRIRCRQLELPLTANARRYWSTEYGINSSSYLLDVPGFDIISCMLHDPMLLFFEGVTMYETKLLLRYIIFDTKYVNIAQINRYLTEAFIKLPADRRPNIITNENLLSDDNKMKQTAHKMWVFSHMLPSLIGFKIPENDDKWKNYLHLLQIQQLVTCPVSFSTTGNSLTILIAKHNKTFQQIYPQNSYIPKLLFMVHLPDQLRQFGPLRHQWCMQMEAKNDFFKRKSTKTKNLPMSVAYEHQLHMCSEQRNDDGSVCYSYLLKNVQTKKGICLSWNDVPHKNCLPSKFNETGNDVFKTTEATHNGVTYAVGDIYLHTFASVTQFPVFVKVLYILRSDSELICVGNVCHVEYFNGHLNSFCLSMKVDEMLSLCPSKALVPWPVFIVSDADKILVSPYSMADVEEVL